QPSLHQQYSLSLRGGGKGHAYQLSLGYDHNRSDIVGNSSDRWTLAVGDRWTGSGNKLEVGFSLNMANQNSLVQTALPSGYVYDRLADGNGTPLAIAGNYSTRYINAVRDTGLQDWDYVPLEEIGMLDHSNSSYDLRIN